ncbi:YfiT family bacillithiol transferase [Rubrolithibacter danxiaensis]|uniref:YfiT family bacillithiol transferase n=1 Tax=Rubrolithibacter danxiaensis TaxID=3390805 RepID=UPI003BF81F4A
MEKNSDSLKYPIGKFVAPENISEEQIKNWIETLGNLPAKLRLAVSGLTDEQLDTPYRPGGWTLRQVVHHLPDSHMNAYIRFKLAITEENPFIKPYYEDRWAECTEAKNAPPEISLNLLESLHSRWTAFLSTLNPTDLERTYVHPEHNKTFILKEVLGMYVWHGEHHLAHILMAKQHSGW